MMLVDKNVDKEMILVDKNVDQQKWQYMCELFWCLMKLSSQCLEI